MTNPEVPETPNAQPGPTPKAEAPANGGKIRSETAYPYYGLSRAIEIVEAVRRAGGNEAPNADVMREMNVAKTTDRFWAYGIPAAVQFELVERVGRGDDGHIKITELGLRLTMPGNPDEERLAKVAAFKTPDLYSKLLEKFAGHPVPTKDGLKNILYRDFKIVESMAPIAAEAFLDSLKVAGLVTSANSIAPLDGSVPVDKKPNAGKTDDQPAGSIPGAKSQTITVPLDFIVYRCKIGKGRIIEIPLPPDFTTADVKRLYAFLQTQVDDEETIDAPPND